MKITTLLACLLLASSAHAADCYKNARGKVVCAGDDKAVTYNPNTGTAVKGEKNDAGVTTVEGSGGGKAKVKNGKGVVKGPGDTTCVKTAKGTKCR
ncbi:MAG: hypothetical protein IV108_01555 [Burkholderiales bacterium]|nr:hypothetical protein [Burkholderiales bacterium]